MSLIDIGVASAVILSIFLIGVFVGSLMVTPSRKNFEEAKRILMRAHGCKTWDEVKEIYKQ